MPADGCGGASPYPYASSDARTPALRPTPSPRRHSSESDPRGVRDPALWIAGMGGAAAGDVGADDAARLESDGARARQPG